MPGDPMAAVLELMTGQPDAVADPYPRYRTLREEAPVLHMAPNDIEMYVLSRYEDCKHALHDPRLGKFPDRDGRRFFGADVDMSLFTERTPPMLFLNPPDHTRLRGLVSRAFTPRRIEAMRPRIEALVDELLDGIAGAGEVELLDTFGFPLPVAVIGELVGVPPDAWPRFRTLVRQGAASLELNADDGVLLQADAAMNEMFAYFEDLVTERRRQPRDDLVTALLAVEEDGDALTVEELIVNVILLFAAGFETTTNLIGNGVVALCQNPAEMERLRADPSLVPSAVEELLRFDSPVQLDGRAVLEPAELHDGTPLAEGQFVITLLGAANRDPARFPDPERLDVGRPDNAPLSFAWGIHHCLGAALARAEGQIAFARLLDRFSTVEIIDDPPRWRRSLTLRGLDTLHVRLTAA